MRTISQSSLVKKRLFKLGCLMALFLVYMSSTFITTRTDHTISLPIYILISTPTDSSLSTPTDLPISTDPSESTPTDPPMPNPATSQSNTTDLSISRPTDPPMSKPATSQSNTTDLPISKPTFRPSAFGVNLFADISGTYGIGESSRGIASQILASDKKIPLVINYVQGKFRTQFDKYEKFKPFLNHHRAPKVPYFFNIFATRLTDTRDILRRYYDKIKYNHFNIMLHWWEAPKLTNRFDGLISPFDEILTVSEFVARVMRTDPSHTSVHNLGCIGFPSLWKNNHNTTTTTTTTNKKTFTRDFFGIPPEKFVFGFVWDGCDSRPRKNAEGLVEAFARAFITSECSDVTLVLKCRRGSPDKFLQKSKPCGEVIVVNRDLTEDQLQGLYDTFDVYVSLHRSEGLGNGIIHAMSKGKAVIFTNYSGIVDFANDYNAYPVKYSLNEVGSAIADIEDAARAMREVYHDQQLAKLKGQRAKSDVERTFSPQHCGNKFREYLLQTYNDPSRLPKHRNRL
eukprot:TRINITY_DN2595_c0_g2_i1.p1 TRINITY_DN2595_c0_g2~~TRINITY_DN2595_c0_g2_i1.p1  ORF type:complete len:512 (-),score=94.41 TRINITY_DN2595_c0_g2_i1:197-1732(-)